MSSVREHIVKVLGDHKGVLLPAIEQLMAEAWEQGRDAEFQRSVMKRQPDTNPYKDRNAA